MMPEKARMPPIERSNMPLIISSIIPHARIPVCAVSSSTTAAFAVPRKRGRLEDRHPADQRRRSARSAAAAARWRCARAAPCRAKRCAGLSVGSPGATPLRGKAVAAHAAFSCRAFGAASSRMPISVARRGVELAGDPALRHHDDAVRQRENLRKVGRDDEQRDARLPRGRAGCGRCPPSSRRPRRASARRRSVCADAAPAISRAGPSAGCRRRGCAPRGRCWAWRCAARPCTSG